MHFCQDEARQIALVLGSTGALAFWVKLYWSKIRTAVTSWRSPR